MIWLEVMEDIPKGFYRQSFRGRKMRSFSSSSRGIKLLSFAGVLFAAAPCLFPYGLWGSEQAGSQPPASAAPESQAQTQSSKGVPPATASQPPQPALPDLDTLLAQFNKKMHDEKVKRIVVINPQARASGQKAIQDWVVSQVKEALSHDPNGLTLFQDKPGDGSDLGEGNLRAAGIDTIVSVSAYPNGDHILITLHAVSGNANSGYRTTAQMSQDIPATDEMATLLPPEWKKQIEEEKAAPKVPLPTAATTSGPPVCRFCEEPSYPSLARELKIVGPVLVEAIIGTDGTPHDMQLVKGLGFGLDEQAVLAVSRWKFKPAQDKMGKPVATRVMVEVSFRLR